MIEKLIKYIDRTGIKKKKIAETLKITPQYLSNLLSGNNTASFELECRIVKLVG